MRRIGMLLLPALSAIGCGGQYVLTAGDHIVAAGRNAAVVVRLQRNDFFVLNLPVKGAAMRFHAADGAQRAAYTDKLGYGAAEVPVPQTPCRCALSVNHMDTEGQEVGVVVPVFVWDPARPVVVVEVEALPLAEPARADAAGALRRLATEANILYLTRKWVRQHGRMREQLASAEYPDGPIALWQSRGWHIVPSGRFKLPRFGEAHLASELPELRKTFTGLSTGICSSGVAARTLADAGMRVIVVGSADRPTPGCLHRKSWADLRQEEILTREAP